MTAGVEHVGGRQRLATLVGFLAVLLWALLALFTAAAGAIPPFQLLSLSFATAFLVSLCFLLRRGRAGLSALRQPWPVWAVGVGGLFGYHLFYFIALQNAPPVEAGLIAYLWPLLIVIFSAMLPGEKLRWFHVAGALLGLLGAALLVTDGGRVSFKTEYMTGYIAALVCALIWSSYSVINRRFGTVPTEIVSGFCAVVAVLGAFFHLLFEPTVLPTATQWLAIIGLGLGPVGIAFFFWDFGTKHGHIQTLGASSYMAPLLSTIVLVAAGLASPSLSLAVATILIVCGAALAAKDMLLRRGKQG
ncbi:aromatic amino acid exporter YddG [Limibacillus halophilus]|uniref:Drug/metabolite transporter (DMT)-like permease n=1 Tax=Limibacillus halophilus TaxID=1579333 RepID=A0A839SUZ8_9PROT|nr:DMT family transporter [Limibacillus halophilus]MBB3066621.1 drug/metabolite transporter (DMT)-like permease [Limibacillus halophilus]